MLSSIQNERMILVQCDLLNMLPNSNTTRIQILHTYFLNKQPMQRSIESLQNNADVNGKCMFYFIEFVRARLSRRLLTSRIDSASKVMTVGQVLFRSVSLYPFLFYEDNYNQHSNTNTVAAYQEKIPKYTKCA